MRRYQVVMVLSSLLLVGFILLYFPQWQDSPKAQAAVPLRPPATDTTFLHDEAGITAYTNLSTTIRLDYVASAFRTIEDQTDEYIIGWVHPPDYDISFDVQVYVRSDGWVVAYYAQDDPVSKIFDWKDRSFSSTLLEQAITKVLSKDGLELSEVNFYDFRYPEATHMMWIKKNKGTYYINVPNSFVFYERSWMFSGLFDFGAGAMSFKIDGVVLGSHYGSGGWKWDRGVLTEGQLLPDLEHQVSVSVGSYIKDSFTGLVLVYRDPNATP